MTTIAYRAGIMACDSAWSDDNTVVLHQNKIVRTKHDVLIGSAGESSDRDFLLMMENIRRPGDLPRLKDLEAVFHEGAEMSFLISFWSGELWSLEKTEHKGAGLFRVEQPFLAIGSGFAHAMTAMDLKCSAERAVTLACKRDKGSRLPVHTFWHQRPAPRARTISRK